MRLRRGFFALALSAAAAAPAVAQNWKLMGDGNFYLGQYFFDKQKGSLNGLADADVQIMRNLSTSRGYYFDVHSVYTGFKQVNELAGGGTLFQQSWDNMVGFKWLQRFEDGYSLKPRVGFMSELFRETNDENWGNGLYDFVRYEAGLALEHKTRIGLSIPWTWELSYDLYYTHYPHFTTLASQFGSALGAPSPGSHVLDAVTNQLTYRNDYEFPGYITAYGAYSMALVNYTDSKVVNNQDQYLSSNRSDIYQSLNVGANKRFSDWQFMGRVRPVYGLGFVLADLTSNQNNFDTNPAHTQFTPGYFNYWETHVTPNLTLTSLKTLIYLSASYDFAYRGYTARPTQNADGTYNSTLLNQTTHSVTTELGYPLPVGFVKDMTLKFRGTYASTTSNTLYQQTYVYNYWSYSYFAGLEVRL